MVIDQPCKLLCLGQVARHRLLTDDVDVTLEEGPRDREMELWRRGDNHGIDAVRPRRFALRHLGVVRITAVVGDQLGSSRCARDRRIDRQHAGDEVVVAVDAHRHQVGAADDGVAAAADEPKAETPAEFGQEIVRHRF